MSADAWKAFGREEFFVASGLLSWESAVYGEFVRAADRILLIGSGSGRDLLVLRQAGHEVVGVEQSPATTAQAHALLRQHGLTAPIVEARFEQAAIPGAFDAIVFSWFLATATSSGPTLASRRCAKRSRIWRLAAACSCRTSRLRLPSHSVPSTSPGRPAGSRGPTGAPSPTTRSTRSAARAALRVPALVRKGRSGGRSGTRGRQRSRRPPLSRCVGRGAYRAAGG